MKLEFREYEPAQMQRRAEDAEVPDITRKTLSGIASFHDGSTQ